MKKGPPKKGKDLTDLHGTTRKRYAKKDKKSPSFRGKDIKFGIPRGLPESVREKVRIAARYLADHQISKDCDRAAFERYAQHLHMVYLAYMDLKRAKSTIIEGKRGALGPHPAFKQHRDSSFAALKFEEQFGLTPLSRGRVKGEPKLKESELEKFQKKGGKIKLCIDPP